jgi:hypothetical protein
VSWSRQTLLWVCREKWASLLLRHGPCILPCAGHRTRTQPLRCPHGGRLVVVASGTPASTGRSTAVRRTLCIACSGHPHTGAAWTQSEPAHEGYSDVGRMMIMLRHLNHSSQASGRHKQRWHACLYHSTHFPQPCNAMVRLFVQWMAPNVCVWLTVWVCFLLVASSCKASVAHLECSTIRIVLSTPVVLPCCPVVTAVSRLLCSWTGSCSVDCSGHAWLIWVKQPQQLRSAAAAPQGRTASAAEGVLSSQKGCVVVCTFILSKAT